jgi:hypothetical protein
MNGNIYELKNYNITPWEKIQDLKNYDILDTQKL